MRQAGQSQAPGRPLRVAMATMSLYPQDPRVRREAEALARCGVAVDVVCLRDVGQTERESFGAVTAHRVMPAGEKSTVPTYIKQSVVFFRKTTAALAAMYRRQPFALIQIHNLPDYLVFVARPFKREGIPVLLDLHDLMPELFNSRWHNPLFKPFAAVIAQTHLSSCRFADHLLTTSEGFARKLLARGIPPDRISRVLNSADHHIFDLEPAPSPPHAGPPRLLYHGTVAPRFGIHLLIEALARLQSSLGEVTLQLHGNYDSGYRTHLERRIAELNLGNAVSFGGYLDLEEVRTVIQRSDLGVVPYVSDPFMDLALSTKVFEYVASGLPVVASRLPSAAELFDDECLQYFRPGDADDLARQVAALWADPDRRERLSANAHAAYQPIAWPVMERRYLDVIGRLAGVELRS